MSAIARGGIIAAGEGSRLRAAGFDVPKPLIEVAGRPLIGRVVENFKAAGISRLTVIFNAQGGDCARWLRENSSGLTIDLILETTPSSFASFKIVADRLAGGRSLISTVDAWIAEADFIRFARAAEAMPDDAVVLGVTKHIDDEKPLLVDLDQATGRVCKLGGATGSHATAGVYVLPSRPAFEEDMAFERLRDYLRWLVESGRPVCAVDIPKVVDVDRAADIETAERLFGA